LNKLTPHEVGYIAGIIDADGTMGMYKEKGKSWWHRIVAVSCADKKLVDWLHEKIPSNLYTRMPPSKISKKIQYTWSIARMESMRLFLEKIVDFLITKESQALIMIKNLRGLLEDNEAAEMLKKEKKQ